MRLIDADALKANVPETRADIFEDCRRCTTLMDWEVKELVDKQPTVAASPWHRVEEELPVKGEIVIVSDGNRTWDVGQYRCLAFSDGDRTKWWWKGHTIKTVKWWMRKKDAIPEPPKEDA